MSDCRIKFQMLAHGADLPKPAYETDASVGMDIRAAIPENAPIVIDSLERVVVPCGFSMALPDGFEAQIRPRSGLAAKNGITVANAPGTIDPDYRGEVKVILVNLSREAFTVERGMRIAQMVITPASRATFILVDNLDSTKRGTGGFGSTGTH